ncbi:helicase associated domain-containing protein [Streptomyces sp. NPDC006971]|uniref:helicase associated domain-containing protein n=1 Tax=Streptomyces sp. NPDC006971 TaxID=3154784 RepID=UPI003401D0CF
MDEVAQVRQDLSIDPRAVESYEPDGGAESAQSTSRSPHSVLTDAEEQRRREERVRELKQMLKLTRQRSQRVVVDWLRITVVVDPASWDIEQVMQATTAYQATHGDLKVPPDWEEGGVRLGVELGKLRRKARADKDDLARLAQELGNEEKARKEWMERGPRIHPDLVRYLAERGFVWEPRADGRALLLAAARTYIEAHGHLLPRGDESVDVDGEEVALGALLAERRRPGIEDTELDTIGALPAGEGMPRPASWAWRVPEDRPWTAAWHASSYASNGSGTRAGRGPNSCTEHGSTVVRTSGNGCANSTYGGRNCTRNNEWSWAGCAWAPRPGTPG